MRNVVKLVKIQSKYFHTSNFKVYVLLNISSGLDQVFTRPILATERLRNIDIFWNNFVDFFPSCKQF